MSKVLDHPDIRAVRTRTLLKEALLTLMTDKNIDQIRIKEITEKAGVNRVTYYDHFSTKEELLTELIDDVLLEYADIIESMPVISKSKRAPIEYMKTIRLSVGHIKKHHIFYSLMLLTSGVPNFSNRLHDQMSESLHQFMHRVEQIDPDLEIELLVSWIVGGAIGMYKYWLNNGMRQSEEELSRQMLKIALASSQVFNLRSLS